jgi:hypothetical protein
MGESLLERLRGSGGRRSLAQLEEKDTRHQRLRAFGVLGALLGATAYSTALSAAVARGVVADVRAAWYVLALGVAGFLIYALGGFATYYLRKRLIMLYGTLAMAGAVLYFLGFVAAVTAATTAVGERTFLRGCLDFVQNEYTQPARDSPIANTFWSLLFDDGHAPTLADTDQLEQAAENMVKSFPPCCLCGEDAKGDEWFSQNCRWPRGVNSTDEEPVLKLARSIVYATYPGQCPVTNSTPAEEVNLTVVVDSQAEHNGTDAWTTVREEQSFAINSTEPRFFTLREELSRAPEDGGRWGAFWDVGVSKQTKAGDLRALRDTHACLCDCAVKAAAPTNWDSNVSAIGETKKSGVAKFLEQWDPLDCPEYYALLQGPGIALAVLSLTVSLLLLYSGYVSFELARMRGMV